MNALTIKLRAYGRKLGLHNYVYRVRVALGQKKDYEKSFNLALKQSIRQGDTVWDVGANVGLFTALFCEWVGTEGRVVAFEPNPSSLAELRRRLPEDYPLTLMDVALGSSESTASFIVNPEHSRSSHLQFGDNPECSSQFAILVRVSTGDSICELTGYPPNVVKIDVEGFEDDVLLGLQRTLSSPVLRAVLIEVHFQALQDRGRSTAPIEIEKLLKAKGFRLKWVDPNHLKAERP